MTKLKDGYYLISNGKVVASSHTEDEDELADILEQRIGKWTMFTANQYADNPICQIKNNRIINIFHL